MFYLIWEQNYHSLFNAYFTALIIEMLLLLFALNLIQRVFRFSILICVLFHQKFKVYSKNLFSKMWRKCLVVEEISIKRAKLWYSSWLSSISSIYFPKYGINSLTPLVILMASTDDGRSTAGRNWRAIVV